MKILLLKLLTDNFAENFYIMTRFEWTMRFNGKIISGKSSKNILICMPNGGKTFSVFISNKISEVQFHLPSYRGNLVRSWKRVYREYFWWLNTKILKKSVIKWSLMRRATLKIILMIFVKKSARKIYFETFTECDDGIDKNVRNCRKSAWSRILTWKNFFNVIIFWRD